MSTARSSSRRSRASRSSKVGRTAPRRKRAAPAKAKEAEPVKPRPNPAGFGRALAAHLRTLTPRMTAVLKKLINHTYPPSFDQLDIEIHVGKERFPLTLYYYRKGYDQVFEGEAEWKHYPSRIPMSLLSIPRFPPAALLRKFNITDDDTWQWAPTSRELTTWFTACWRAAGGARFPYRAEFGEHDSRRRTILAAGKRRGQSLTSTARKKR